MVEHEYAKAVFELAVEKKKTEEYLDYFDGILDVTGEQKEFFKLIASPLLDKQTKLEIVANVFKSLDDTFVNFLKVLVTNEQLGNIASIADEYQKILREYKDILKIEVISAKELTAEQNKSITKSLKERYPNKKLIIENSVNPKILYGLQIICNGESLDMSLKNMLTKMKNSL